MGALIFHVIAWPTLGFALLVFGFAPGALLRLIVLLYPPNHPRRRELIGELYSVPRIERPFWVAEQLETGLFEGLRSRLVGRRAGRAVPALVQLSHPATRRVTTWELWLPAELSRPARLQSGSARLSKLTSAILRAISTGAAKPVANLDGWPRFEQPLEPDVIHFITRIGSPRSTLPSLFTDHTFLVRLVGTAAPSDQKPPDGSAAAQDPNISAG